ncbi:MAG: iron export ABC transporter permease subunit FetB [Pelistega sp.]|nr:iron export ABC transporter permease subunit FetB [Pelistega sp.]
MDYHIISYTELLIAASLILINGAISLVLRLGLEKTLLIASVRTVLQLFFVGFVLKWVFSSAQWYVVLGILCLMTLIAAFSAKNRRKTTYRGAFVDTLLSIWLPSWIVLFIGITAVIRVEPWYTPQYLIPIGGMIIGNSLTAVALSMERLLKELTDQREKIQMYIGLGASSWEAYRSCAQQAITAGMMPTINSMMVVGLVSLPGMMTGQILAGQDPDQAIRYQIIVMFFLAAATGLSCLAVVYSIYRRFFDSYGHFLYSRLIRLEAKK